MPLFRAGLLLLCIPLVVSGHSSIVSGIGVVMMVISLVADFANILLLRSREHRRRAAAR
ncbi:MAG: hypothetical protein ACLP01_26225 [Solirubrobacteraceae bacterium]